MELSVIILAAGQGTRMRSALPKVLHGLAGRPLLAHVIATAQELHARTIRVVYGHGGRAVPDALGGLPVTWVEQAEQLGTGHAVLQAMSGVNETDTVLVLYGDVPLIRAQTLRDLVAAAGDALGLLTVGIDNPSGYGRIVRGGDGRVARIVEEKDATEADKAIREVNTGMLAVGAPRLRAWLGRLENDNAQGEYYLTDIIAMAVGDGVDVITVHPDSEAEVLGVNNRVQLAQLERQWQRRQAEALMLGGVTLMDPQRLDVRGDVAAGSDVIVDVNVILEGRIELGDRVRIGPNTLIRNTVIGAGVEVLANCVIEDAVIGPGCRIGPFARIRPESELAARAHIGNFVEIKKSQVGEGSKINHLSYIGDTTIGRDVNIGAGTITCNYDGAHKHRTVIGDNAFIGSDTQLVAPVTVGAGATIGAGSTITRDVPPGELALSRVPQQTRAGWQRPTKKK